jgi:hypothetical protein
MNPMSRRTLLRGAGGVAIALPFLDAMGPRSAYAQAAKTPRRLFIMVGHNGIVPGTWFPSGTEKMFTLAPAMMPFEPIKENLLILDGITKMQRGTTDGTAHGRGSATAVSGWTASGKNGIADGASVDQFVANAIGTTSKIKSFMLGRPTNYHFLFDGPKQVHFPEPDVKKNFDRLFTGFTPPAGGGGAPDPAAGADLAKARARKKSILDAAMEQYKKVAATVGTGDRKRLDFHAEAIRNVERQIEAGASAPSAATMSCAKPADTALQDGDYQLNGKANMNLAALAFACDLTKVAGYQWISHGTVFSWLGSTEKHHPLAHQTGSAGADAQLTKIVTWHAQQASDFLQALKSYKEGAGSVLDNTIFLWTHSVSVGSHKFDRTSMVLASGKFPLPNGKTLETGRYLKVSAPHTSVLQWVAQAMGAPNKFPVYGDWDKGPLALLG